LSTRHQGFYSSCDRLGRRLGNPQVYTHASEGIGLSILGTCVLIWFFAVFLGSLLHYRLPLPKKFVRNEQDLWFYVLADHLPLLRSGTTVKQGLSTMRIEL